jgi:hypothetical protein
MTNQPTPTVLDESDRVIEAVQERQTAEADVTDWDELRRKRCERPTVPQKSRWRFW